MIRCEPRRQINRDWFVTDSAGKTFEIAKRQRELGAGYFMFTDAFAGIVKYVVLPQSRLPSWTATAESCNG